MAELLLEVAWLCLELVFDFLADGRTYPKRR